MGGNQMGTIVKCSFQYFVSSKLISLLVVAAVIVGTTISCKTSQQVSDTTTKKAEKIVYYNVEVVRDTFVQKDSVFQLVKGDSVIIEKWHNIYNPVYRYKTVTDTVCKTDTVIQYQTNNVQVTTETNVWQCLKSWLIAILLAGVIALVLFQLTRYIIHK